MTTRIGKRFAKLHLSPVGRGRGRRSDTHVAALFKTPSPLEGEGWGGGACHGFVSASEHFFWTPVCTGVSDNLDKINSSEIPAKKIPPSRTASERRSGLPLNGEGCLERNP